MTNDHDTSQMIPGLELVPENQQSASPMREAVIATINALHADQLLQPRHAGLCQLALELPTPSPLAGALAEPRLQRWPPASCANAARAA